MKKSGYKAVFLTVGMVIVLIAGCEGENTSKSEMKMGRLIAAENKQMEKQIEQLEKELEKQKGLLAKSQQEGKSLEEKLQKSSAEQMKKLNAATEENITLKRTNYELNDQIKSLNEELEVFKDSKKFKEWQEGMQKTIDELMVSATKDLEEIERLREENTELKRKLESRTE